MGMKKCNKCGKTLEEIYFQKAGKDEDNNQKYKCSCKICTWIKSHKNLKLDSNDLIIVEKVIINNIKFANDLLEYVNLELKDICERLMCSLNLTKKMGIKVKVNCMYCGEECEKHICEYLSSKNCYCSKDCNNKARVGNNFNNIIGKGNCLECGEEFDIRGNVKGQKFCSNACKSKYYSKLPKNQIDVECACCKQHYKTFKGNVNRSGNNFCSTECQNIYIHRQTHETRNCEICGKEFECKKVSTQRFCDIVCQGKWQSTQIGEINPRFTSKKVKCDWCGKLHYKKQYKIKSGQSCFCSEGCYRKWMSNVWSQTEEVKEATRIRAVKMLEDGAFNHTNTGCQNILNELLNDVGIKYINEKNIDNFYSVDNYLTEYNLIIEVMGTYWHCDPRKYKEINYRMQYNRIIRDKAKHTHIKNKGINILYLWEEDLNNNIDSCKKMIEEYINGNLTEFHSFNFNSNNRIKPYQEYESAELNKIVDLSVKEKMSKKDDSKWTTYNCDFCGKEDEELTSHYVKHDKHFCCKKCYNDYVRNKKNGKINIEKHKISMFH